MIKAVRQLKEKMPLSGRSFTNLKIYVCVIAIFNCVVFKFNLFLYIVFEACYLKFDN